MKEVYSERVPGREVYAHSREATMREDWQTLEAHQSSVSRLAANFAAAFGSSKWTQLLGLIHDIGKARTSFQAYLAHANGLLDEEYDASEHSHSGAGACWAVEKFGMIGRTLAYCVAGHHAGLPDWIGGVTPDGALSPRLAGEKRILDEQPVKELIVANEKRWNLPRPPFVMGEKGFAFWIRMLYSCLVDADFLDTEEFMDAKRAAERGIYPTIDELSQKFFTKLEAKQSAADKTEVNQIRAEIRATCETAAEKDSGLFSLTVPTGGGKTLSAMAFAFRHALKHGQKRIIYVIPYTSIIEQTADTLRDFLGDENVLEHHSNFDPAKETQQSRLASENWDAPIIVTTTVQFFESLYAYKSSRCRKLHNIANSVIILDEVQLLPTELLKPCLAAIEELATHYQTTLILSTATQPDLLGLCSVREIIPAHLELYNRLKRTQIEFPKDLNTRQTWEEIAAEISKQNQVLCVVNTRKDCRQLFDLMPEGTIHLSATMCGAHRSKVIDKIKTKLKAGEPIRVVSTQLVEAGVDIDFPVVYRAFTGLASIAQSAGRCNREGKLDRCGRVIVFMPPEESPSGELRHGEYAMRDLLAIADRPSFDSPEIYPLYFEKLHARAHKMGEEFSDLLYRDARDFQFQFREAAKKFQMIKDECAAVIVRYGENKNLIDALRAVGPKREIMRKLQRYTVNVPRKMTADLLAKGFIEEMHPGVFVQTIDSLYSDRFGLDIWRDGLSTEDCII